MGYVVVRDKGTCHRQGCSCWKIRPETVCVGHLRGHFEVPVFASPRLDPWHLLIASREPETDPHGHLRHAAHRVRSAIAQAGRSTRRLERVVLRDEEGSGVHQELSWGQEVARRRRTAVYQEERRPGPRRVVRRLWSSKRRRAGKYTPGSFLRSFDTCLQGRFGSHCIESNAC